MQVESISMGAPPFRGQFLMGCDHEIAACAGGQITWDGGFEIRPWASGKRLRLFRYSPGPGNVLPTKAVNSTVMGPPPAHRSYFG